MDLRIFSAAVAFSIGFSCSASAATVSHGALSSPDDGSSLVISDSQNGYEWLRFDVTAGLDRSQTVAALGAIEGGGWSIASEAEAYQFLEAILSPSLISCTDTHYFVQDCGGLGATWDDGDFGANLGSGFDSVYFDAVIEDYAGLIQISDGGSVKFDRSIGPVSNLNNDAAWLAYRVSDVPLPAAAWLFGSALLGLGVVKRRKLA